MCGVSTNRALVSRRRRDELRYDARARHTRSLKAAGFPPARARSNFWSVDSEHARFPADFVFGVATSAYQVEGHIENDWAEWERAGKLKEPHVRCGRGVDHWNRFGEDLKLVREVGAGAFRISLEWARIEPTP